MIVRSNIITTDNIISALHETFTEDGGMFFIGSIREFKPRRFERGFKFFCGGSSARASAHDPYEKAATWVEWGIFIDYLFKIDPDAEIGWYTEKLEAALDRGVKVRCS